MDLYSTQMLSRIVESLKRTQTFFLGRWFTQVETSDTETIFFDIENAGEKRRLSPYVHPLVEGKVVESAGFETKSFRPAYIKDKRVHDVTKPFKRIAGETIGTGSAVTPQQRREIAIQRDLRDQIDMLNRRLEFQAVEALRDGTVTVNMLNPDGTEKEVVVDFKRDTDLQITKAVNTRWGDSGISPIQDLEDWALTVLQTSGSAIRNIVMDVAAWRKLRASAEFEKRLDLRRVQSETINVGILPEGVQYMGNDGTFNYFVYTEWYYDPDTSAEVPLLDTGRVIGIGDVLGVRHFGAIKDEAANFQAKEYFVKSWLNQDPSVRYLLMQSAPLMVPYRINASFSAKVLA